MVGRQACKGRAQYARANVKAIIAHYLGESKRLDDELTKAKEGKEADLASLRIHQVILVIPDVHWMIPTTLSGPVTTP